MPVVCPFALQRHGLLCGGLRGKIFHTSVVARVDLVNHMLQIGTLSVKGK
jgi:hypothetical protein